MSVLFLFSLLIFFYSLNNCREAVLRTWHKADPVDALEMQFNDAVFALQKNRSPFIDHPEWVALILDF